MNPDSYVEINQLLLKAFDYQPITFVDIETTGVSPVNNRMIEIGIVRIDPDASMQSYTSLVNPDQPLSFFIRNMTGIRQSEVDSAPKFEVLSEKIKSLLENAIFIAHNVRFDYSFIQSEFSRCNHLFNSKTLCTVQLSRKLYPEMKKHSLAHLIDTFNISVHRRHRALDDAQVMHEWIRLSHQKLGTETIRSTIESLMKDRFKKTSLPDSRLESIPPACGAYILRDTENRAVYVGRGLNLKKSVWAHLHKNSTHSKERKIAELTSDIDYFKTTGELSAYLKSVELIQSEDPIINKKLNPHQKSIACIEFINVHGYKSLRLKSMLKTNPLKECVVSTFKSKRIAVRALIEVLQTWNLCSGWMGTEPGQNACSGAQLSTCQGACTHQESTDLYNARFDRAFNSVRFQKWPYPGWILLTEQGSEEFSGTAFLVHQWSVKAVIEFEGELQNIKSLTGDFDWDAYLILRKYLSGKKSNIQIKTLSKIESESILADT